MQDNKQTSSIDYSALAKPMTYQIGNRTFIVEAVFKEDSNDTLATALLRLMKVDCEK